MIELDFKKTGGLIPAIAQDWKTGEVLMLAYINEESWKETLRTGHGVYWSRSRSKLWHKGEESGNVQIVKEILVDCDADHPPSTRTGEEGSSPTSTLQETSYSVNPPSCLDPP